MPNSWEHLANCEKTLVTLDAILKKADPASGISFMVRRGIARDDDDLPDDAARRPWAVVEVSDIELAANAISNIRLALTDSIAFWRTAVSRDIKDAQKELAASVARGV